MLFVKKEKGKMDEFHFGMEWHFYVYSVAWPIHSGIVKLHYKLNINIIIYFLTFFKLRYGMNKALDGDFSTGTIFACFWAIVIGSFQVNLIFFFLIIFLQIFSSAK
jgi:hypothetical protein